MIPNIKQLDKLAADRFSKETILEICEFLKGNDFEFYNLANVGGNDARLMYRDDNKKMQCKFFQLVF